MSEWVNRRNYADNQIVCVCVCAHCVVNSTWASGRSCISMPSHSIGCCCSVVFANINLVRKRLRCAWVKNIWTAITLTSSVQDTCQLCCVRQPNENCCHCIQCICVHTEINQHKTCSRQCSSFDDDYNDNEFIKWFMRNSFKTNWSNNRKQHQKCFAFRSQWAHNFLLLLGVVRVFLLCNSSSFYSNIFMKHCKMWDCINA